MKQGWKQRENGSSHYGSPVRLLTPKIRKKLLGATVTNPIRNETTPQEFKADMERHAKKRASAKKYRLNKQVEDSNKRNEKIQSLTQFQLGQRHERKRIIGLIRSLEYLEREDLIRVIRRWK